MKPLLALSTTSILHHASNIDAQDGCAMHPGSQRVTVLLAAQHAWQEVHLWDFADR